MKLHQPPEQSPVELAIEDCEQIIQESVVAVRAIREGRRPASPSHRGPDYDDAYHQGRKDAARIILLTLGVHDTGPTSLDEETGAAQGRAASRVRAGEGQS